MLEKDLSASLAADMRLARQKIYASLKACVSRVPHSLCTWLHCFVDTGRTDHLAGLLGTSAGRELS